MAALVHGRRAGTGLFLPATLLVLFSAVLVGELSGARPEMLAAPDATILPPQTVIFATAAIVAYHPPGDYEQNGKAIASPSQSVRIGPLEITKYEVSRADYGLCVADGACERAQPRYGGTGNVPAAGVSFNDASAYAAWLSVKTGENWRLPTMAEWDFAADGTFSDRGAQLAAAADPDHPWLAGLDDQPVASSPFLRPLGGFGTNPRGVADMGGNVWEWTSDCHSRTRLAADGSVLSHAEFCGVRVLEGPARMPMSAFVQDARGGGCLATVPPDNLGFRLVREHRWFDGIVGALRWLLGRV